MLKAGKSRYFGNSLIDRRKIWHDDVNWACSPNRLTKSRTF